MQATEIAEIVSTDINQTEGNEFADRSLRNDELKDVPIDDGGPTAAEKVKNMENVALFVLRLDDDLSLNPWTFRTLFLGDYLDNAHHFLAYVDT